MPQNTFIARQPILDRSKVVYGYELLHRSGPTAGYEGSDPDRSTIEVMSTSLLVNRLSDLVDGLLGFVNIPANLLVDDLLLVFPAEHTVLELLETIRPSPEVVAAVRRLKNAGMRIALDDFVDGPSYEPLVELADVVKIDFQACAPEERRAVVQRHARPGLMFVAEKVETRADFDEALDLGYDLFQGYFFCRPEIRARRDLPRTKVHYLELLREISRPELDLHKVEDVIKREISLSAKLLRYLNSVQFGLREEISSIQQALVYLGDRPLRRWGSLVAISGLGHDKPLELVKLCLVRARFCETLASEIAMDGASLDLFLTGLFSAIDALVDRPLKAALAEIGLKGEIESAICGDSSSLSRACRLAVSCERGDTWLFSRVARQFGLTEERVAALYAEALFWADGSLRP